jgi:hypothetical protein
LHELLECVLPTLLWSARPTAPGISGFEFVVGAGAKRTLIVRDAQHEYVFTEQ